MIFEFQVIDDNIYLVGKTGGVSENVNTYNCKFEIDSEYKNYDWFAVFKTDEVQLAVLLVDNKCKIPYEVLKAPGIVKVGCYATNFSEDNLIRPCTNFVSINILEGAFSGVAPEIPELSEWENIILKTVPKIGDNGNWFVYDITKQQLVDTGINALGSGGIVKETDPTVPEWAKQPTKPNYTANEVGALPNTTKIPSKVSELDNDRGYLTEHIDISGKEDKPIIITDNISKVVNFEFSSSHNKEYRFAEVESISFTFGDGEYPEEYICGFSFDSGATPTAIDYTDSGILNWQGTDCVTYDGLSIFQPSENTHYDVVVYFTGRQFVGLVHGYVPTPQNAVSA